MKNKKYTNIILMFISLLGYIFLYYGIERSEFFKLIIGVIILGVIYFYWLKIKSLNKNQIILFAIIFRASLLFDSPNFSDDYFRFIWDGNIIVNGENPYEETPFQIMEKKNSYNYENLPTIYEDLNSPNYFTVYPPLNQFFFASAVYLSGNNPFLPAFFLKIFILLFEIGLIFILFKMLRKLKLQESLAQIYALNPLVIIELTGNVHFEGVMLFFLMLGIYFVIKNKIIMASLFIGFAINVKLVPLLLLPLFLPFLGIKKSLKLYVGIGIISLVLVLPFISQQVINNFSQSLELYFQTFEFNASIYYVLKGISFFILGYKTSVIGILTPTIVFISAILFTILLYKKRRGKGDDFDLILFSKYASLLLFIFYLLASTVHPWYIINILIFSVFISNRAFVLWSILSFISYFAYSSFVVELAPNSDFHRFNMYYALVILEYVLVLSFFFFERRNKVIQ